VAQWLSSLGRRVRAFLRRRDLERDLRDEIAFHVGMREAQLRASGAADACAGARRTFGGATKIREELYDTWALAPRLGGLAKDVAYAARMLRRHRGFATVVVLTLGFGIGVNTATFSVVSAVLIRPLGFAEPEQLVMLHERLAGFDLDGAPFSPPDFLDVQRDQQSFEGVAAYLSLPVELSGSGDPVRLDAAKVSANLFSVLGVRPLLGRDFAAEEDRPGVDVAVLSWGLWQTRYGGDRAIVGQAITIERRPYTVVGVMPAAFEFPRRGPQFNNTPAALWVPMTFTDQQRQARGNEFNHGVIGRLRAGVSIEEARSELDVLATRINASFPPVLRNAGFSIGLSAVPLREAIAGQIERPLLLLLAAVGLVLLVTCANVANLVLGRTASRAREIAVRTALGSSRARLLQLLLAEAAILSVAGGLLGILFSVVVVRALPATVTEILPAAREIPIDVRVLAFSAGITMATSLLFALLPLATMDRHVPGSVLQEETSRTTPGARRHRVQAGLVVSTVTLAFVLLAGAGLFIRSFSALMATDGGFEADRVLTASLTLPRAGYSTAASVRTFHEALFTRASSLTGVRSAALVTDLPLERYERRTIAPEGVDMSRGLPPSTNLSWVYGPYFETLGIRVTSGRAFSDVERVEPRGVVIINERLARTYWPGADAVGKRLRWGLDVPQNPNPWLTVIGIIADVADGPLGEEPFVHAWEPFSQFPDFVLNNVPSAFGRHIKLAIRTDADPKALVSAVRAEIGDIDRQLAIESIATMDDRIGDVVAPRRFSATTLGLFSAGSLLLAAIGLYGLLTFLVAERRREIAVRLALGAEPPAILRMVVGQGLKLVSIGLVMGAVAAYGVARAVGSLLYRTESHDVMTFVTVPVVLVVIALVACALPAWRASRVEPLTALRAE
jgi:putative ABC transport system permease protein